MKIKAKNTVSNNSIEALVDLCWMREIKKEVEIDKKRLDRQKTIKRFLRNLFKLILPRKVVRAI